MEKKRILLIGTGGTIASEMGDNGLEPELTSRQLLRYVPDISGICEVDCTQLFSLDSTNIRPEHWLRIAGSIQQCYEKYDGFVISHGTDTMAYTAAGLSYLIQNSRKPIVLTGAQKPIGYDTTDSKQNLRDAFTVAASGMSGVLLVFNGKIIMGTRARKTRSKSFEAFSSINYPIVGMVQDGRLIQYIRPENSAPTRFYHELDARVALLKLTPGIECGVLEYLLERSSAVIIESFGVGGLPVYETGSFYDTIKKGLDDGRTVVLTTQVENEGSDLSVYHVGNSIKQNLPILEAYDMTTEAVTAKLMWILSQTTGREEVARLFYTPVACDILSVS
ncbi:MAG: asparaginase [Lachnospiraceae bacterium]|jgi:L-asparaginase|nr:asparaginase [Lachnospiraceae bacterium]MCI8987368.1 asparaginase [Lachnospiraceae bacterium]MDE6902188.1 asparaginase [Lachnospiraceae bacterium]